MQVSAHQKAYFSLGALVVLLLTSVTVGTLSGTTSISSFRHLSPEEVTILYDIRLPRVLLAMFVGMALSIAGVAFQALLRNPLADPYNLGVSGGAALGNVIAASLGASFWLASTTAFGSAILSVTLIYTLSSRNGRLSNTSLLLAGVIFNAFAISVILFIFNFLDPQSFQHVFFQLIGSLDAEAWSVIASVGGIVLLGFVALFALAYPLNLLLFGEESATSLGLNVEPYRRAVFLITSVIIAISVSVSGLIGFVGLCVPHIARLLFGSDHRLLIPASGLLGASFLILADTLARTALSGSTFQTELPVGVVTTLVGAPFFVFLLRRNRYVF